MKIRRSKNFLIAISFSMLLLVLCTLFLSNVGAASNEPLQFNFVEAAEKLGFLFGFALGLPNIFAIILGVVLLILPAYFVFRFIRKKESF